MALTCSGVTSEISFSVTVGVIMQDFKRTWQKILSLFDEKTCTHAPEIFAYCLKMSSMVSGVWIGLNDLDEYGIYHWAANNESLGAWNNWGPGEPSHSYGRERCAIVRIYWNDKACDGSYSAEYFPLCEQSPWKYQHKFMSSLCFSWLSWNQESKTVHS